MIACKFIRTRQHIQEFHFDRDLFGILGVLLLWVSMMVRWKWFRTTYVYPYLGIFKLSLWDARQCKYRGVEDKMSIAGL